MAPNITSPKTTEKEGGSRFAENEREGMGPKGASPMKGGEGQGSEGASPMKGKEGRGLKGASPMKGEEGRGSKHCFAEDKRDAPWEQTVLRRERE